VASSDTARTALVTGASKGIGLATARRLARAGYEVVGWSRNSPEEFPGKWMRCDVSDSDAVQAALGELLAVTQIDCLVNNTGLPTKDQFGEIPLHQLATSLDFHARVCLQTMQAVVPGMKERGWGRIVNVLSTIMTGYSARTSYRAGKEAAKSLTISAALELAPFGITVNGVAPGPTATDTFSATVPPGTPGEMFWLETVPMRRLGKDDDIAGPIEFLLSDAASYITGQILYVDGGASAGRLLEG
jgi:NAD(P)-dependent dehydrogenase (short-subunit alcohol dehydrogenase family)